MKRSGSRLLTKARSLRNISRSGFRFRYKLILEQVDKLTTTSDVSLVWERGSKKSLSTKPVKVGKNRVAKFNGAVLEQQVTLFRKKGSEFDEKVYRLSLKAAGKDKVVAKINLDFSKYAGVPSGSRRVGAQLSHGGQLVMRIESVFVEEVDGKKKNRSGAGSQGSRSEVASEIEGQSTVDSGDVGNVEELDGLMDDDDFGDLNIDEDDQPKVGRSQSKVKVKESLVRSQSKVKEPKPRSSDELLSRSQSRIRRRAKNRRLAEGSTMGAARYNESDDLGALHDMDGKSVVDSRTRRRKDYTADGASEIELLRRENRRLKRLNEELRDELRDEGGGSGVNAQMMAKLSEENKKLRERVADLEYQMKREPAYHEVVRDLKEAKMALALLNLEKEELHHNAVASRTHHF